MHCMHRRSLRRNHPPQRAPAIRRVALQPPEGCASQHPKLYPLAPVRTQGARTGSVAGGTLTAGVMVWSQLEEYIISATEDKYALLVDWLDCRESNGADSRIRRDGVDLRRATPQQLADAMAKLAASGRAADAGGAFERFRFSLLPGSSSQQALTAALAKLRKLPDHSVLIRNPARGGAFEQLRCAAVEMATQDGASSACGLPEELQAQLIRIIDFRWAPPAGLTDIRQQDPLHPNRRLRVVSACAAPMGGSAAPMGGSVADERGRGRQQPRRGRT